MTQEQEDILAACDQIIGQAWKKIEAEIALREQELEEDEA